MIAFAVAPLTDATAFPAPMTTWKLWLGCWSKPFTQSDPLPPRSRTLRDAATVLTVVQGAVKTSASKKPGVVISNEHLAQEVPRRASSASALQGHAAPRGP